MTRRSTRQHSIAKILMLAAPFGGAALLLAALRFTGISQSLNLLLYDLITHLRPAPSGASTPVTIIGISEADISLPRLADRRPAAVPGDRHTQHRWRPGDRP